MKRVGVAIGFGIGFGKGFGLGSGIRFGIGLGIGSCIRFGIGLVIGFVISLVKGWCRVRYRVRYWFEVKNFVSAVEHVFYNHSCLANLLAGNQMQ